MSSPSLHALAADVVRDLAERARANRRLAASEKRFGAEFPEGKVDGRMVGLNLSRGACEVLSHVPRGLKSAYVSKLLLTYVPPGFEDQIACARSVKAAFESVFSGSSNNNLNRAKRASSVSLKDANERNASLLKGSR